MQLTDLFVLSHGYFTHGHGCVAMALVKTKAGFVLNRADGHAVAHPVIESVPYTASIQQWVQGAFPGCTYVQHDCDGIVPLDMTVRGVTALQAPKGCGKSKAVRAGVAALPDATTVVQITFRRSLAWTSSNLMGPRASLYSDVFGTITAAEYPRHTIVVNSIARLQGPYDVVIIDELVAVMDSLASSLLTGPDRVDAVRALTALLTSATTVVVADAMLDATALRFVLTAAQLPAERLLALDYIRRIHDDYVFYAHENANTWHAGLRTALQAGKRVVVPCMTKSMALAIEAQYSRLYVTQGYSGDTDPVLVERHMTDIHTHWARVQLLVYSPVITAGCSFELKHFHVAYFYGFTGLSSIRNAIQMIARVRDIEDKTVHVYIDRAGSCAVPDVLEALQADEAPSVSSPATVAASCAAVLPSTSSSVALSDTSSSFHTRPYLQLMRMLHTYRRHEDVTARDAFAYGFWTLVRHSGARIRFLRDDLKSSAPPALLAMPDVVVVADAPPRDLPTPFVRKEHWTAHGWDGHETGLVLHRFGEPVACHELRLPIAQRVAGLNPDHMLDCGFMQSSMCELQCGDDAGTLLQFPAWCSALDSDTRMRAWCRLVTQKATWGRDGTLARRLVLPTTRPATRCTVLFDLTCMGATEFASLALRSDASTAARQFLDAKTAVADVLQEAWVLAGVETAFRYGTVVPSSILEPMLPCPDLAATLAARVTHVTRYAYWVGINVAMPQQGGVLDYLYMDHDGCFHACTVRVSGDVVANARLDLLKTQAMLSSLATPRVSTVRILYVRHDESVVVDVSTWSPAPLRRALTATGVPPWPLHERVVYAAFDATASVMRLFDPLLGATRVIADVDELWRAVGPQRRLVSWNYTLFSDGNTSFDDCVYDIALALRIRLTREHGEDALQVCYAHVIDGVDGSGRPTPVQDPPCNAQRVRMLYIGVVASGLLVYLAPDSAQPEGVTLRCVPSVSFMRQYFSK